MKKILLLGTACLMCLGTSFAQRKQNTVTYTKVTTYGTVSGPATYSYVIGDDGSHLKDGALNINADTKYSTQYGWDKISVSVTYKLNASYYRGMMNGAASSTCKVIGKVNSESTNMQCTFSGNFLKGIPNGDFRVKNNINMDDYRTSNVSLSAHYSNGILTGAYSYTGPEDIYNHQTRLISIKGNLTSKGLLTGTWTVNDDKYEFVNGVLVNKTLKSSSMKPSLAKISRQYANGDLSKEDLRTLGYMIRTDSLNIGDYARTAILDLDDGFDFRRIDSKWDFTISNNVKYETLTEVAFVNEDGVEYIINSMQDFIKNGNEDPLISNYIDTTGSLPHISVIDIAGFKQYMKNPDAAKNNYSNVYITPEQYNKIDSSLNVFYDENAVSLRKAVLKSNTTKKYLENLKISCGTNREYQKALNKFVNDWSNLISKINRSKTFLNDKYELLRLSTGYYTKNFIIDNTSYSDFNTIIDSVKIEAQRVNDIIIKQDLSKTFDFIVVHQKPSRIVWFTKFGYGTSDEYFYSSSNYEFWKSELEKNLKPFCDIIGYEIIDVDTDSQTVLCNLIKKGKKKKDPSITYQISIKYNNEMKLCAESFDITKAKQL